MILFCINIVFCMVSHLINCVHCKNSEGWEKLGLYEYYKAKNNAKREKEDQISAGLREKSRSPSPVVMPIEREPSPPKRRYMSRSPSPVRGRRSSNSPSRSRSRSPKRRRGSRGERRVKRSVSRSPSRSPPPPIRRSPSPTTPVVGFRYAFFLLLPNYTVRLKNILDKGYDEKKKYRRSSTIEICEVFCHTS